MPEVSSFGNWLKARRRETDLTQFELAQRIGCSEETIGKIEAGTRRPSRQIAELIADELGVPPEQRDAFVLFARSFGAGGGEDPLPPAASISPAANNLPLPPTPLVGRGHELAAVIARLRQPEVRLLTLTGVGGTGKTRLALEVAASLLASFPDGVYFVSLAPVADPQLVLSTVAGVLDVREAPDQPLIDRLGEAIDAKCLLLVLDNFEHLAQAAPQVADLLSRTGNLKVLATSRERLHLRGEREYPVPPLLLPDLHALPALAELAQSESVRLFVERAQDVAPEFMLTEANGRSVAAICHRLEGLPLAIELAAPRIRVLPPAALLAQLSSRLGVLTSGAADLPDRQRTLRDTIAWSHNLLTETEQMLFRRLGVFSGGCTLEAVQEVCGRQESGELSGFALLNGLSSLVDKHLLRQQEQDGETARFWMLETIREYALERLEQAGEAASLRQRHAAHYLSVAEHYDAREGSAERLLVNSEIAPEEENLRAALGWLLGQDGEDAVQQALRLGTALRPFWNIRGHHAEGSNWLQTALARAAGLATRDAKLLRARAVNALSFLAPWEGSEARARARMLQQENVALWRELGNKEGLANGLLLLAMLMEWDGYVSSSDIDVSAARSLFEESLALAREIDAKVVLAHVLFWIALFSYNRDELQLSRACAEESFKLFTEIGDSWAGALPNKTVGDIALMEGDLASARRHLEDSYLLMEEAGDIPGLAGVLQSLGNLAYLQSDYKRTRDYSERSLLLWRAMGDPFNLARYNTVVAARAAREQGDYAAARSLLHQLMSTSLGARVMEALAGVELAQARELEPGQAQRAVRRAARLLGIGRSLRDAAPEDYAMIRPWDEDQKYIEACRALLDEETWQTAWGEGQAMSPEEARAFALEDRYL